MAVVRGWRAPRIPGWIVVAVIVMGGPVAAQDLEPRRWGHLPVGQSIIGVGYANVQGGIQEPTLEVLDATYKSSSFIGSYQYVFDVAGLTARFDARVPFVHAKWRGVIAGEEVAAFRDGLADPRFRLSVNLIGSPALSKKGLQDFVRLHPRNTVVGIAVSMAIPAGEYDPAKFLNIGTNRFTFRPQIGAVHRTGPWSFELTASAFLYTDNNDFVDGLQRKQRPRYAVQTHVTRLTGRGLWMALGLAIGTGGEATVDGVPRGDQRTNVGGAFSTGISLGKGQSVSVTYSLFRTLDDVGSDPNTFVLGWSIRS